MEEGEEDEEDEEEDEESSVETEENDEEENKESEEDWEKDEEDWSSNVDVGSSVGNAAAQVRRFSRPPLSSSGGVPAKLLIGRRRAGGRCPAIDLQEAGGLGLLARYSWLLAAAA